MERIGIYGGTFSPPHIGHTLAARAFCQQMRLDRLLIIPCAIPPHKEYQGGASAEQRLHMCEIAFRGIPTSEISDMEIARGGKSYSYETLEALADSGRELFFLVGTDMFLTLDKWRLPEKIFSLATIALVRREDSQEAALLIDKKKRKYEERYSAKISYISVNCTEVSSTEIRDSIRCGRSTELIDSEVLRYIRERGLYK